MGESLETERSNSPDKVFKILVIKMLTNLEGMGEHSENFKKQRKYKKVPNRSHRGEHYNYLTEKYTTGIQQTR